MKVSYNWLKEYVDITATPAELANKITLTGIEVEGVSRLADGLKKIVVGYVETAKPHPNSDHMTICQVNIGEDDLTQIVCGAPNVAAGQKVIVALPGARIAGNEKIKKGKLRGEVSNGMICALQEIGFSNDIAPQSYDTGIYVLPADAKVGDPVYPYLGMDDAVLDLAITPNRADAMSMHGVAYEVAAIYGEAVHFPKTTLTEDPNSQIADYLTASVANETDAPSYNLRVIKDIKIQPSPLWLQKRLWNAGIRPIDNIVDVTNYMMLTFGQPMHAFDYDQMASKQIAVRRATANEPFTTLDGEERTLTPDDIVITNGDVPTGLAGVMGGLDSEITPQTKTVVLESAIFNPTLIRKTAQRYNLRSEASSRFEKGTNKGIVLEVLDAAAALMAELGEGKVVSGVVSPTQLTAAPVNVTVTQAQINHKLGTAITIPEITKIFQQLHFGVTETNGTFNVSVPTHRWDIAIAADLIEEVVRLYGYDRIPATLTASASTPGILTASQRLMRQIDQQLEGSGLSQAISYALTTPEKAQAFNLKADWQPTSVDWPMTQDHQTLRMSLISGLLDDLAYNVARKQNNVALYEQGRVFVKNDATQARPAEVEHLAGAVTGIWQAASWQQKEQAVDFYQLKGIVEQLLHNLHFNDDVRYVATEDHANMHPGQTADIYVGDTLVGLIGQVHPQVAQRNHLAATFVFELDMTQLQALAATPVVYQPVAKYPAVTRDIALLVDRKVQHQDIVAAIYAKGGAFLQNVTLFDLYEGHHVAPGKKSLAYTLTYQNANDTLTDDQVNQAFEKIQKLVVSEFNAEIR